MCGITSQFIRRMRLSVADLTLKKAVDIAVSMELTNKEVAKISSKAKPVQKWELHVTVFIAASRQNDFPQNCFHKNSECQMCQTKRHINPQCPQKMSATPSAKGKFKQP